MKPDKKQTCIKIRDCLIFTRIVSFDYSAGVLSHLASRKGVELDDCLITSLEFENITCDCSPSEQRT